MVKRREPQIALLKREPSIEEIEAFAAAADTTPEKVLPSVPSTQALDPNAIRDFKAIRVPFNEYEFKKLEELAAKTGRSKLNAIRWAILKLLENEEN